MARSTPATARPMRPYSVIIDPGEWVGQRDADLRSSEVGDGSNRTKDPRDAAAGELPFEQGVAVQGTPVTPQEFIEKWSSSELKESASSQTHFNDICRLLSLPDTVTADPKGEWFTFEKGASKTAGGDGWADVWRKGCFAWEYKGKKANLDKAFQQIQQYAIALENPPLLIVSDMDVIRIHTNWTNTVQRVHTLHLDDMSDAGKRDLLRACFEDPDKLKGLLASGA